MSIVRAAVAAAALVLLAGCGSSEEAPARGGEVDPGDGEVVKVPGVALDGDSAALSADGSRLAVPCDGSICVWSTADGVLTDRFDGGTVVAWSPDGDTLATDETSDGQVSLVLLDADSGEAVETAEVYAADHIDDGTGQGLLDVAFSPDGEHVAAVGGDGVVRVHAVTDPAQVVELETADDTPVALAWSPDGAEIAVASSNAATTIYYADSGTERASLADEPQGDIAWSSEGSVIATASFSPDEASTAIRHGPSGAYLGQLPRAGYRVAFGGAKTLVFSEKNENDLVVWKWGDDEVRSLKGSEDMPRAVMVAPDGSRIYAVSPRGGVLAWDVKGGKPTAFESPED